MAGSTIKGTFKTAAFTGRTRGGRPKRVIYYKTRKFDFELLDAFFSEKIYENRIDGKSGGIYWGKLR